MQHSTILNSQQSDITQSSPSPEYVPSIGHVLPSIVYSSAAPQSGPQIVVWYFPASSTTFGIESVLVPASDILVHAQSRPQTSRSSSHIVPFPSTSTQYVPMSSTDSTLTAEAEITRHKGELKEAYAQIDALTVNKEKL